MRGRAIRAGAKAAGASIAALLPCAGPAAAESQAGTVVVNVAQLTFGSAGATAATASNPVRIVVAERLDVALAAGVPATAADGTVAVPAIVVNGGNGRERFGLAASAGGAQVVGFAIDVDGDGRYDPASDTGLDADGTPALAPGQSAAVFVLLASGATGSVTITAAARTGSGAPGTGFDGQGDGGGDAVVGPTGASAAVTVALGETAAGQPTLVKSARVLAPDGSARATRGATITYTLVAGFAAATRAARVADPIPAGTVYVPASLVLDGTPLSDAADDDAGTAADTGVAVLLGDQPAGATRTIRFQVTVQ